MKYHKTIETPEMAKLPTPICSAFEEWWEEYGIRADPPVLELAYKEIAFKGWVAAAEKCATVCEFWGDESRSVILTNFMPNTKARREALNTNKENI